MSRREYPIREVCAEPECREQWFSYASTQRDYRAAKQRWRERPYRCMRHSNVDQLLTPTALSRTCVLVARRRDADRPDSPMYWHIGDKHEGAYVRGPGHLAYAEDFPEGTVLVITADIGIPDPAEAVQP